MTCNLLDPEPLDRRLATRMRKAPLASLKRPSRRLVAGCRAAGEDPDMEAGIALRVLGPLEVSESGRDVAPRAAKPRRLLLCLAVDAGRVVSSIV
jgi:hypothetical protein